MVDEILNKIDLELDTDREGFFMRQWRNFKTGLLGTLYVMANETNAGMGVVVFSMWLDTAQLLAFSLSNTSEFPWNETFSWLWLELLYYAKLEFYISEYNAVQNVAIYWVFFFLVFLNLGNAAYVGYWFLKEKPQKQFLLKTLRIVTNLFTTILYQPILSQFTIIFAWAVDPSIMEGCPLENLAILGLSSMLITVMFTMLALIVAASFYDSNPASTDPTARSHSRCELIFLLSKAIITLQQSMFDGPEHHWSLIFSILVIGIIVTYMYIYYLPFYNWNVAVLQAQLCTVFLWSGICLLIAKLNDNPDDAGPITLFYCGAILVWKLARDACDWRRRSIEQKGMNDISSHYEAELSVRYWFLRDRKSLAPPPMVEKIFKSSNHTEEEQEYIDFIDGVEQFYFHIEKKFEKASLLQLFIAQFYVTYKNSSDDAVVKINKANAMNPAMDEQFIIYKSKQQSNATSTDTIASVQFNSRMSAAFKAQLTATTAQVQFWKALSKQDWEKLLFLSKTISKNMGLAQSHFHALLEMKSYHSRLLRMYAYFQADCLNEIKHAEDFLTRASKIETKVVKDESREIDQCMFEISMEQNSVGEVLKTNEDCQKLLIQPKSAIINSQIQSFMPSPFKELMIETLYEIKENVSEQDLQAIGQELRDGYVKDSMGLLSHITYFIIAESQRRKPPSTLGGVLQTSLYQRTSINVFDDSSSHEHSELISEGSDISGVLSQQQNMHVGLERQKGIGGIAAMPAIFGQQKTPDKQLNRTATNPFANALGNQGSTPATGFNINGLTKALMSATETQINKTSLRRITLSVMLSPNPVPTLLLNGNYIIQLFNREAEKMIGITVDVCGVNPMNKYIFSFEERMAQVMKEAEKTHKPGDPTPEFNTYICTSMAKIIRVRLSYQEIYCNNEKHTLIFLKQLPPFTQTAERFLKIISTLMITRVANSESMQLFAQFCAEDGDKAAGKNQVDVTEQIVQNMKKEIEEHNSKYSPELGRMRYYFKIILLLEALLFVGCYIASSYIFETYTSNLDAIKQITDIQNESILLANYMILLDFARQGVTIPDSVPDTLDKMSELLLSMESNKDDIADQFPINALEKRNLPIVTISDDATYKMENLNLADSISKQALLVQRIIAKPIETYNIIENDDSFWIFQNGRVSIAQSLENAANRYMDIADEERAELSVFTFTFSAIEISLMFVLALFVIPLIRRSEAIFASVLNVFNWMESYIVRYLYKKTKNNLEELKNDTYPDNMGKIESEDSQLRQIFLCSPQYKKNKSLGIEPEETVGKAVSLRRQDSYDRQTHTQGLMKNSILQRLLFLMIFWIGYIAVLQMWLSQIHASYSVRNAATMIKHTGTFNTLLHRGTINLAAAIYFDDSDNSTYSTMQESMTKAFNITDGVHMYNTFYRIGDDDIVDYDYVYELMKDKFDDLLIGDGWVGETKSACKQHYHQIVERGLFDAVNTYLNDIDFLLNENYANRNVGRTERYLLCEHDINRFLDLDLKYLNSLVLQLQSDIRDYYDGVVTHYNLIQSLVLTFYIISMFIFQFYIIGSAISRQEKRKRLTRKMLLILPRLVIKKSDDLQKAIADLDYN